MTQEAAPDSMTRVVSRWKKFRDYPGGPYRFIAKYWVIKLREDVGLERPLGPHLYLLHEAMGQGRLTYEDVGTSQTELQELLDRARQQATASQSDVSAHAA